MSPIVGVSTYKIGGFIRISKDRLRDFKCKETLGTWRFYHRGSIPYLEAMVQYTRGQVITTKASITLDELIDLGDQSRCKMYRHTLKVQQHNKRMYTKIIKQLNIII